MAFKAYSVTDLVISPRQVGTGQPAESSLENADTFGLATGCWCQKFRKMAAGVFYLSGDLV